MLVYVNLDWFIIKNIVWIFYNFFCVSIIETFFFFFKMWNVVSFLMGGFELEKSSNILVYIGFYRGF